MSIYTKKGDKGETGLPGGRRLPKPDIVFECLGTIDETNTLVGLALSHLYTKQRKQVPTHLFYNIQSNFLSIGACIASEKPGSAKVLATLPEQTIQLEKQIDKWDRELPPLQNFILPGGTPAAATFHQARTVIRRAERAYHRLDKSLKAQIPEVAIYLNRLSDFFFQTARYLNYKSNFQEQIWKQ